MNYQVIYNKLIDKVKSEKRIRNKNQYYEAHHIIPICLGGEGKTSQWRTHSNIVLLTAKEHYIAHKLLYFLHPHNTKIVYAYWAMASYINNGRKYRITSSEYQRIREEYSKQKSQELKGTMVGKDNPFYGKKQNPEWVKQHSKYLSENFSGEKSALFGTVRTESSKVKQGQTRKSKNLIPWIKGKNHTEESKLKMSESKIGVFDGEKNPMFKKKHSDSTLQVLRNKALTREKKECEHCGKIVTISNYSRHHGKKCTTKQKKEDIKNGMSVSEYSKKWHQGKCWASYYIYKKEVFGS